MLSPTVILAFIEKVMYGRYRWMEISILAIYVGGKNGLRENMKESRVERGGDFVGWRSFTVFESGRWR